MQAGASGRACSPLRAPSRPERLARECEPYQMAAEGRRRVVSRTKRNSFRFISNSLKAMQHRSSLMNRDLLRNRLDRELRRSDKESVTRKMMRIFLIGMLCGVSIAATFTYAFAIPANDYHWQLEIFNRGGAAFTVDKDGHRGWMWLVQPKSDTLQQKGVTAPPSAVKVRTEQL